MHQNFYDPFSNSPDNERESKIIEYKNELILKSKQKREIVNIGFSLGFGLILCLVMQTVMSLLLKKLNMSHMYLENSIFFSAFNSIAISIMSIALPFGIIALTNKKHYVTPLIPTKKVGFFKGTLWVSFGLMACVYINYFVGVIILISEKLGYKLNSPDGPVLDSVFACVMLVISTMIMPAVCEEFSMRCCAMGMLRKHGKSFAVFAVSIIFGLLHGNVIQFIFAFLVGGVLAFITMKTDNILPAVAIHALNNGRSVIYDIIEYASSTDIANKSITVMTIVITVLGGLAAIILAIKNEFNLDKTKYDGDVLTFGKKLLYLLPGLSLPLLLLIGTTLTSIEKM